jgi:glycogen debranching enzyme
VSRTPDGVEVGDASLRPNQIFAVSLPHSPLDLAQQKSVVDVVRSRLLTPMGLRTLDPRDPRYAPRYRGTLMDRDRAYHNGTAWPWLVGAYAKALLRIGAQSPGAAGLASAAAEARDALAPLLRTIHKGASLGSIAEVFDAEPSGSGDDVQRPDGCMAQAWSVACTLEALIEVIRAGG